jgi:hypothetical protein
MPRTRKQWYAWTEITQKPTVTVKTGHRAAAPTVKQGTVVTAPMLGLDKEEWDDLVRKGAIRSRPFPKTKHGEAPKVALLRIAREELEAASRGGNYDDPDDEFEPDDDSEAEVNPNETEEERLNRLGIS